MSRISNLAKALGLGAAATILTAGVAFAATAVTPVHVRSGPGTNYRVLDTLYTGEYVRIVGRSGGWCRVTKSGPDGWVSCAYLTGGGGRVIVRPPVYQRPPSISFGFGFGSGFPWWYGHGHHDYHDHHHHHHH